MGRPAHAALALAILAGVALGYAAPADAGLVLGVNGGMGVFNSGIGPDPVFGAEVLDPLFDPLLTGFYGSYSILGGATQGTQTVGASLINFGLELEYPLGFLIDGLAVGVRGGLGYETVPVGLSGSLVAASTWVIGVTPSLAYDFRLSASWTAGLEADFAYDSAPSFNGLPDTALLAPTFLIRLRYAFGQGAAAEGAAHPAAPVPAPRPAAPKAPVKKPAKSRKKRKPVAPPPDDNG